MMDKKYYVVAIKLTRLERLAQKDGRKKTIPEGAEILHLFFERILLVYLKKVLNVWNNPTQSRLLSHADIALDEINIQNSLMSFKIFEYIDVCVLQLCLHIHACMFDTCIIIHLMQSSSAKSNVNELRRKLRVKGKRKREISHSKVHISKKADRHRQTDRQTVGG